MSEMVKLVCNSIWFYSDIDEEIFFEWLQKIPSIQKIEAVSSDLNLYVDKKLLNDDDFRELLALFYRYKVDMKQLQTFLTKKNREWFYGSPKGYWHYRVFGKKKK